MRAFDVGDRVRVDIPDETDPDFDEFHRRTGEVIEVIDDEAAAVTGDDRDAVVYRVSFDDGGEKDFRWRDLRPVSDSGL